MPVEHGRAVHSGASNIEGEVGTGSAVVARDVRIGKAHSSDCAAGYELEYERGRGLLGWFTRPQVRWIAAINLAAVQGGLVCARKRKGGRCSAAW